MSGTKIDEDLEKDKRSALGYGADIDLTALDLNAPSGEVISLDAFRQVMSVSPESLMKLNYQLTNRYPETKKNSKNTRVRFKNSVTVHAADDTTTTIMESIWISFPTEASSIKQEELTPGRFKTLVAGIINVKLQNKGIVSPVMDVIGFKALAEKWDETVAAIKAAKDYTTLITAQVAVSKSAMAIKLADDIHAMTAKMVDDDLSIKSPLSIGKDLMQAEDRWEHKSSLFVFSNSPDRVPFTYAFCPGVFELGASLALMQDVRNAIRASILSGTAAEKQVKKSSFYQSLIRRTGQYGAVLNQSLFRIFFEQISAVCSTSLKVGQDLDDKVREMAQGIIDAQVKRMSENVAMKV